MSKGEAIIALYPSVINVTEGKAYDTTGNEVAYNLATVEAYLASNSYKQQRATAYPSVVDQLDTLYHGGYDVWKATITAVKEEFPKP